ncbi:MAG: peptidylprolyl isomerase [Flavobacteriales bacterium]|nr:peptidylprolyl isomerase [Flavobacteriales bacterium]
MSLRSTNKFLSLLIFIAASTAGMTQPTGEVIDQVVAVIGGYKVLRSDVESQYIQYEQQGVAGPGLNKCQVFEDLMFEKLLLNQAEIDSVEVTDEQVKSEMDRRMSMLEAQIGGIQKLEEFYGQSVVEIKEEMRSSMRAQMTAQRMQQEVVGEIEVTPAEVRRFFRDIPHDSLPLINSEVEVAQIVKFPEVREEAKTAAMEELRGIKKRIEEGSKFSTMAILYSEDPGSSKNGGLYEGVKRGQFVKEFEGVAFALQPGEISDVFETQFGYHICQLEAKRGQEIDVRHILIVPKITPDDLQEAQNFLDSLKLIISDGILTFEEAAMEYSDDKNTRNNGGIMVNPATADTKFEISELDRSVYFTIEEVNVGEIAGPINYQTPNGQQGFRLVRLISRSQPHRANLKDDYQRLQMMAKQKKQQDITSEWVEDRLNDTYIRVMPNSYECNFQYNWKKNDL